MENLTDIQLLAMLLGKQNNELAEQLLNNCDNSLTSLESHLDFAEIKGLGNVSKQVIKCAIELGRRIERAKEIERLNATIVNNSRAIFGQFNAYMSDLDHEELWALYCSKSGKILGKKRISIGGTDYASADAKFVVHHAIVYKASHVALCHNHPHSTTRPSSADKQMTKRIKNALALFDINLLDHLIISDGRYYSFADNAEI